MFIVATYGSDKASRIVGNHNISNHTHEDDARDQVAKDVVALAKDGYELIGSMNSLYGESELFGNNGYVLEGPDGRRLVNYWEE